MAVEIVEELSDGTVITGYFEPYDNSFDHEFGTERRVGYALDYLTIYVSISGEMYEISDALDEFDITKIAKPMFIKARGILQGDLDFAGYA